MPAPLAGVLNGYILLVLFSSIFNGNKLNFLLIWNFKYIFLLLQLQAYFLVLDDIMDNSQTRRGQPCWFRVPQVRSEASILFTHQIISTSSCFDGCTKVLLEKFGGKPELYKNPSISFLLSHVSVISPLSYSLRPKL